MCATTVKNLLRMNTFLKTIIVELEAAEEVCVKITGGNYCSVV